MEIDPSKLSGREAYRLMISCIIPRPIAFVTTVSKEGVTNLAPFSFFNGVSSNPPILSLAIGKKSDGSKKDTWRNIEETGEFVVNAVVPELMDSVVQSSKELPPTVSELELTKEATLPSSRVRPPRLARSPIHLECALLRVVEVEGTGLILGRILLYHVKDEVIRQLRVDPRLLTFVGRLGDQWYARVNDLFERARPE